MCDQSDSRKMLNTNTKFLLMAVVLLSLVGVTVKFLSKSNTVIVAEETVPVYHSENDAMNLSAEKAPMSLRPQQKAIVLEDIDVKHYLIYKVRLPDGRVGFINEGKYDFERPETDSS